MTDWLEATLALRRERQPFVLVTVAGVRGSAPREVGAAMLVTARDTLGSIGGGRLEYRCARIAARLLRDAHEPGGCLRRFPLGADCGQCCGGVVDVLFEGLPRTQAPWLERLQALWRERRDAVLVTTLGDDGRPRRSLVTAEDVACYAPAPPAGDVVRAARAAARTVARRLDTPGRGAPFVLLEPVSGTDFDIAVFGAGHVGSALVGMLAGLDCRVRWIDSRRGAFPARLPPNVQRIAARVPADEVAALPRGAFCVVMTHSHALDYDICLRLLERADFAYCGLIGSRSKRRRFEKRMRQHGLDEATIARLVCPIGVRGIHGKKPAEIAVSAAAELLQRRERQCTAARRDGTVGASVHVLGA